MNRVSHNSAERPSRASVQGSLWAHLVKPLCAQLSYLSLHAKSAGLPLRQPLTIEKLPQKAARRDLWQRQCQVVQSFGRSRFEVGFSIDEGNEALIAAGLPTLNGEQMDRALKGQPSDADP